MHAVADPFYKITSEALLVTQQLVKVIRPIGRSFFSYPSQAHYFSTFMIFIKSFNIKVLFVIERKSHTK